MSCPKSVNSSSFSLPHEVVPPHTPACMGYCAACGREHVLQVGAAAGEAAALLKRIETEGRIDIDVPAENADPKFSLEYLWGAARGQMFGVLVYAAPDGSHGVLKAFSCQYNGVWCVDGWVPPVLDVQRFDAMVAPVDARIKSLGREIDRLRALAGKADSLPHGEGDKDRSQHKAVSKENGESQPDSHCGHHAERRLELLLQERKELSQGLMKQIQELYLLANFRGERKLVRDVFLRKGLPTGAGDCCAPKLLQYAALHGLTPLGLAEFYVGRTNRSGTRQHGMFYPACEDKCQPLMGHMLCGLPEK